MAKVAIGRAEAISKFVISSGHCTDVLTFKKKIQENLRPVLNFLCIYRFFKVFFR